MNQRAIHRYVNLTFHCQGEDVFLNPQKATECKLNTELQSDDTDMGQTSAQSQTAAVDMQENQKKSSTSPNGIHNSDVIKRVDAK